MHARSGARGWNANKHSNDTARGPPNVSLQLTSEWRASGNAPAAIPTEHSNSHPYELAAELGR